MRNNSNTPPMGNPTASEAANTYTDMWGNVIEVASLIMWLEDGRYYDVEEGEHRDCARYCTNAEDYQEVDPDAEPDYDDEEGEEVEA